MPRNEKYSYDWLLSVYVACGKDDIFTSHHEIGLIWYNNGNENKEVEERGNP